MPHESTPLISVVIPAFNASRYLLDSVQSIRNEQYEPLEIIIVDDGSTDDTARHVAEWSDVTYLYQENSGASVARNSGIHAASGDLLAFLDADDFWLPGHLRTLLEPLQHDSSVLFAWGASQVVHLGSDDETTNPYMLEQSWPGFLIGAGLYRRAAFETVGTFDAGLRMCEDTDWIGRARHLGVREVIVPDNVLMYRRRAGSLTENISKQRAFTLRMLQQSIKRNRAA